MKRRLKFFRVIAVIVPNCWVIMLLQVKSGASLSCLFFTSLIRRKNRAVETCRTCVMLPLFSHEFESHGRHSYKVFPHVNFGVLFFHVLYYFVCTGLGPIYVIFFEFLPISFQMKNNDETRL